MVLERIVDSIYNIVWSPALVVLLVGAGLYFTIRTRCVQVRRFGLMARLLAGKDGSFTDGKPKGLSSFQAFCVALSGRVGTGNIVGVATAIAMGGPGAVFWMWMIAFLGASTAFMESTLAQMYKFHHINGWRGGPSCYIERGLGQRWLGVLFAICTVIGYGLLLSMVQSNSIASAFNNSLSVSPLVTALVIASVLGIIVIGGVKRIAHVASVVTPFMAVAYVILSLVIIAANWKAVPGVFAMIFSSAFGADATFGGIVGSAIAMGVKRGLFSNEAGEGGGAIVSASADVKHPAQQGLVQAFSVYIDTILVCTATALMILCTGKYNVFGPDGKAVISNAPELGQNYVAFTQTAIDTVFSGFGSLFVTIALAFFAFTTIMAYYFYAESSIIYMFNGNFRKEKAATWIYRILLLGSIIYGACISAGAVWTIGDIGLGLTTWINVIALLILCPRAVKALKDYESKLK